ncbi:MAG: 23S rRNA (pseudouridine(1915)-N(3))-methyltransferase RlmH [Clostridiales bacterium]|jgi:23S rRNA (pseudouridine1915-N3)-methyltransferase|nr:23S rRNA (pseudouridine(1915)-N(3))-methyltransferase RlmH [Clostridiales bacterium]
MIKINVISVGRFKDAYFKDAFLEYKKRLSPVCLLNLVETQEKENAGGITGAINAEAALILERLDKLGGYVAALDGRGEELDSAGFAAFIGAAAEKGGGVINFIIGGSHGLSPDVLKRADKTLSFGKLTYPHRLFRVMLAEQIYRAFMIRANREYHK